MSKNEENLFFDETLALIVDAQRNLNQIDESKRQRNMKIFDLVAFYMDEKFKDIYNYLAKENRTGAEKVFHTEQELIEHLKIKKPQLTKLINIFKKNIINYARALRPFSPIDFADQIGSKPNVVSAAMRIFYKLNKNDVYREIFQSLSEGTDLQIIAKKLGKNPLETANLISDYLRQIQIFANTNTFIVSKPFKVKIITNEDEQNRHAKALKISNDKFVGLVDKFSHCMNIAEDGVSKRVENWRMNKNEIYKFIGLSLIVVPEQTDRVLGLTNIHPDLAQKLKVNILNKVKIELNKTV